MSRSEWKERSYAWQVEPDALDSLCDFISEGGTLSEYTTKRQIKYRMTLEWIESNADRKATYERAVKARDSALQDGVLAHFRTAATIDPRTLFDDAGNLLNPTQIPDEIAMSLTEVSESVSRTGDVTNKIKFTPRHTANVELGRHLGMFRDKVELTGKDGAPLDPGVGNDALRRIAFALEKGARKTEEVTE